MDGATSRLEAAIDRFTNETKASSEALAQWTKVMGITTIVLAIVAFAQVIVAVLAWLAPAK